MGDAQCSSRHALRSSAVPRSRGLRDELTDTPHRRPWQHIRGRRNPRPEPTRVSTTLSLSSSLYAFATVPGRNSEVARGLSDRRQRLTRAGLTGGD